MRKIVLFACFLSLCFAFGCSTPRDMEVGQLAPTFELPDLKGNRVSLKEQRGKIVLLDFWATWCGPCRISMPTLERIRSEYAQELSLLAINLQEPKDLVEDYVRSQNIQSTVLLDSEGVVGQVYRAGSIPMQVLIDQEGKVRHVQIGFSQRAADQLRREIEKLRINP
jgi:thiol-disulfide isomerase/thioredoxin